MLLGQNFGQFKPSELDEKRAKGSLNIFQKLPF